MPGSVPSPVPSSPPNPGPSPPAPALVYGQRGYHWLLLTRQKGIATGGRGRKRHRLDAHPPRPGAVGHKPATAAAASQHWPRPRPPQRWPWHPLSACLSTWDHQPPSKGWRGLAQKGGGSHMPSEPCPGRDVRGQVGGGAPGQGSRVGRDHPTAAPVAGGGAGWRSLGPQPGLRPLLHLPDPGSASTSENQGGRHTYECRPWTPPSIWADMVRFSNLSSPEYIMELERWGEGMAQGVPRTGAGEQQGHRRERTALPASHRASPGAHRRMDRLRAPISWQPCWIPAMR